MRPGVVVLHTSADGVQTSIRSDAISGIYLGTGDAFIPVTEVRYEHGVVWWTYQGHEYVAPLTRIACFELTSEPVTEGERFLFGKAAT